jgi:5-methylcytosine-specific restriction enzyme subunit McrC
MTSVESPGVVRLREYETTRSVPLTVEQRDGLRSVATSIAITPTVGAEGRYDLTPSSSVGTVRLGPNLQLVIRPKLPIDRVLFLVSYSLDRGRWLEAPVPLAGADGLVEAIAPAFVHHARRALARGVHQGYRTRDASLAVVRGRWRIGDQLRRRFGTAPPLEISYDDYTEDIEINRLLRAALRRLLAVSLRSRSWLAPLHALDAKLVHVALVDYDRHRLPDPPLDRRNERYRGALTLARLILAWSSLDLRPGPEAATAFLIDMNAVFQDFVATALREALAGSGVTLIAEPAGLHLDTERTVRLEPDLTAWRGARCTFVGDVKYKHLPGSPPADDLYQLLAYTIATELPGGTLIYASPGERERSLEVRKAGKTLRAVTLDLARPPAAILSQIARTAMDIARTPQEAARD